MTWSLVSPWHSESRGARERKNRSVKSDYVREEEEKTQAARRTPPLPPVTQNQDQDQDREGGGGVAGVQRHRSNNNTGNTSLSALRCFLTARMRRRGPLWICGSAASCLPAPLASRPIAPVTQHGSFALDCPSPTHHSSTTFSPAAGQ